MKTSPMERKLNACLAARLFMEGYIFPQTLQSIDFSKAEKRLASLLVEWDSIARREEREAK